MLGGVCVLCLMQVLGNEESAVSDICTPAGLRPAPDAADLRHFVDVISSMDGLRVAELLRAKMVRQALREGEGLGGGRLLAHYLLELLAGRCRAAAGVRWSCSWEDSLLHL